MDGYFHLPVEYRAQFENDASFTSIEAHIQELSEGPYLIQNPRIAWANWQDKVIPVRGIIPAQMRFAYADIHTLRLKSGLEVQRTVFHDSECYPISEFSEISAWGIVMDTPSMKVLLKAYEEFGLVAMPVWFREFTGKQIINSKHTLN